MNLSQLRAQVNGRSGHAFEQDEIDRYINEALQALASEERWPWFDRTKEITWAADQTTFTMPTHAAVIQSVHVGREEYPARAQRDADSLSTDWTVGYTIWGDTITVLPAPSAGTTVVVRFRAYEPRLVSNGDEPYLPDQYAEAAVHQALSVLNDRVGDLGKAGQHDRRYQEWLRRMRKQGLQRAEGPRKPRVRPGNML